MSDSQTVELQQLFAEEATQRLQVLFDLIEATDYEQSLSAAEVEQICHQLHALKGGARMVGQAPLAELAHRLESELADPNHVRLVGRLQWRDRIDQLYAALASEKDAPALAAKLIGEERAPPAAQRIAVEPAALDALIHQMVEARVAQQQLLGQLQGAAEWLPAALQRSLKLAQQRQLVLLEAQQRQLVALRMVPINSALPRWRELVRGVAAELQRSAELRIDIETSALVDRTVLEQLIPLVEHLLRNAVCHGIEPREQRAALGKPASGVLRVSCRCRDGQLTVVVEDDGCGIDFDRLSSLAEQRGLLAGADAQRKPLLIAALLRGGLSSAGRLSAVSGRGIGLAAVAATARDLGGALTLTSEPGGGSLFTLQLPISVELRRVLTVQIAGRFYLLSGRAIVRVENFLSGHQQAQQQCGDEFPLADAARLLGAIPCSAEQTTAAVLVDCDGWKLALRVDAVGDYSEQRVEPLGPPAEAIPGVAGALLGEDGQPRLVLDLLDLLRAVRAGQLPIDTGQLLDAAPKKCL